MRYVGGCVRKIIKKQIVDDIDLATNLKPSEVCDALKKKEINFYETGIEHGTVTAVIDNNKYEITSLRKDISTDGRQDDLAQEHHLALLVGNFKPDHRLALDHFEHAHAGHRQ